MRRLFATVLLLAAFSALAQKSPPPELEPLPEPPPPPPGLADDDVAEPEVTIQQRGEDTYEEFRINGQLYMIKVTPKEGSSYYLVDSRGDGAFSRFENFDAGVRPPMWVIKRF